MENLSHKSSSYNSHPTSFVST